MATIYQYDRFDLICLPDYMYLGLKPGFSIVRQKTTFLNTVLVPGKTLVTKVGRVRKGQQSSGFTELAMLPGSFLTFSGWLNHPEKGTIFLFEPSQKFPRNEQHLINGDYTHLWVAFFEIDADFLATVTQSNASRLVAREVELLQPALL